MILLKKILLVLTGGTIGSMLHDGIISADSSVCRVQKLYEKSCPDNNINFVTVNPFTILSENLETLHWEKLIHFILSFDIKDYDGIIITHGSDTLTYSSAMLGICLHGLGIPVVITASDYVPDDPKSNALFNFRAAVSLICQKSDGVYTVYKNHTDTVARVFTPTRMCQDRLNDLFMPSDMTETASIDENGTLVQSESKINLCDLEKKKNTLNLSELHFSKSVMLIHPYPSINYDNFTLTPETGAVILVTYHSGTVSEKAESIIARCKEMNVPLFLCSLKRNNDSLYETNNFLIQKGAVPLYDISVESAYAKVLLGINLSYPLADFLQTDLYFEKME